MNETNLSIAPTYIRLLTTPGIPRDKDYAAALELIHDGFAVGKYHRTSTGDPTIPDPIDVFFSFAPTTKGRLFAAELAEAARKKTVRARLHWWGGRGLAALGGAALMAAATLLSEALKQAMNLCA